MKKPPKWIVVGTLSAMIVGVASAWAGGEIANQVGHILFGALSLFCFIGMWFLWVALGATDSSLLAYWSSATATMFTLLLSGELYFFGSSWAALLVSVVAAPLIGGAATLRVAVSGWTPRQRNVR
jgi:hypothetical protein